MAFFKFNNIVKLIIFNSILFSAFAIRAQVIYEGKIIDADTKEALVGATISSQSTLHNVTDNNGDFYFKMASFVDSLTIDYIGYTSLTIPANTYKEVIEMKVSALNINKIIITANRNNRARTETPLSISTISSKTLKEAKITQLDEILNKVSGVYMVDQGNEQHTMMIRQPIGYKGLFLYLEDGIPIKPTGIFNNNALLEMNMASISNIEVIRGPSSSFLGSEAIGGAINFINFQPNGKNEGALSFQLSNNGYLRSDFKGTTKIGKVNVGLAGYYANRNDSKIEHSNFEKVALTLKAKYINKNDVLDFNFTFIDYFADMTGAPDSLAFYNKNTSSKQTFTNRDINAIRSNISYSHNWKKGKTKLSLFYRNNVHKQNPYYLIRDDFSPWNPSGNPQIAHGEINNESFNSLGVIAQHHQNFKILKGAKLTIGSSLDRSPNTFTSHYIKINKDDQGIYSGFEKTDSILTHYKVDLINTSAFLNFDLKLTKKILLSTAIRYDAINYDFKNNLDNDAFSGAPDDIDNFNTITPQLGAIYNINNNLGFFINYSQGFLPPQVNELYRGVDIPSLKPAIYTNYEIGGWYQLNKYLTFDFSLYNMKGKDQIIFVRLLDGNRVNKNAGITNHQGMEYNINWQLSKNLNWRISNSHSTHKFIDYIEDGVDYSGNSMGQSPAFISNSELSYKPHFLPGFRSSIEWQYLSKYYKNNSNTSEYEGFQVFNLRLGYKVKKFDFWINVINIFDTLYATDARKSNWGDTYTVGANRTFKIGIGYRFF